METKIVNLLVERRYLLATLSIALTLLLASGWQKLFFEYDYKIFFKPDNTQLVTHELIEDIYTKSDGLMITLGPKSGDIFTPETLSAIFEITERSWQAPYVVRVDSLTNFQHTEADGEDLMVADLVYDPAGLDATEIARIKAIALTESAVVNRLVSKTGSAAAVMVTTELPPDVDRSADAQTQAAQRLAKDASHPEVVNWGREMIAELQQDYPNLEFHLSGNSVINNSFNELSEQDMATLVPIMYLVIIIGLALFLRSPGSVVGSLLVIALATSAAVGTAGWAGVSLNSVSSMSPLIILTIAVCDCVHLLMIHIRGLSRGLPPVEAMRESLRLNFQPIVLTSITTAVGFLTLNFAASPPFAGLGNITAVGVMWAMLLTFTLLPTLSIWFVRKGRLSATRSDWIHGFAQFVVRNRTVVFFTTSLVAVVLISLASLNYHDDDPINYFAHGVPYRDASEFSIASGLGVNDINFSLSCGEPGCVNSLDYLQKLEAFENYLKGHDGVIHVRTYAQVLRRLNKSMNQDNPEFLRLPTSNEHAAQYNLLYEMSLPFGLDLNNQVNIDKSATRIAVQLEQMVTNDIIEIENQTAEWLRQNIPDLASPGSSVTLMFAHMGWTITKSMLVGSLVAILGITLTILIALRSFRYALISMIPNSVPALMAFGVWGIAVGYVNMAAAAVFSISLGIVVDDTVHFISKYRRGRRQKGLSPEESIYYAFDNVGAALIVTTIVLTIGFGLLIFSDFGLNSTTGSLTAITVCLALIFDFLILPPILMYFDRQQSADGGATVSAQ